MTDLLRLVDQLGVGPIRDIGLLQSAVARPATRIFGGWAYPGEAVRAAALLHSIVRNLALVDGNKRLGLLACLVHLYINGYESELAEDQMFDLVISAAVGAIEVPEIGERLSIRARAQDSEAC